MGVLLMAPGAADLGARRRIRWPAARMAGGRPALRHPAASSRSCVFTDRRAAIAAAHHLVDTRSSRFVIWPRAALRPARDRRRASCSSTVLAISGTVAGLGPFAAAVDHERLVLLQVFMAVMAATALLLGAAMAERAHRASAGARPTTR